jgi:sugar lactone lactonase YvrE
MATRKPARALCATLSLFLTLASAGPAHASREHLDVRVLARVPIPGYPAQALAAPDGKIYTGSYYNNASSTPSKIFAYSSNGQVLHSYTIHGQDTQSTHGVSVAGFDTRGRVYIADQAPPRVLLLNPQTGRQRVYGTMRDVPICQAAQRTRNCSDTTTDLASTLDFSAFGPDGSLYVSDFQQGLIWRLPPGGGRARVWFTDPRLDGAAFGPAGIQFTAGDHRLMVAQFSHLGNDAGEDPTVGDLYEIRLRPSGRPGRMTTLWRSQPNDAPDGFAIARSGNVYVALGGVGRNQLAEISPGGQEIARIPANPLENALMPVPFDEPSGVSFDGRRLLVTNLAYLSGDPESWVIFDVFAGERGLPLHLRHLGRRAPP